MWIKNVDDTGAVNGDLIEHFIIESKGSNYKLLASLNQTITIIFEADSWEEVHKEMNYLINLLNKERSQP